MQSAHAEVDTGDHVPGSQPVHEVAPPASRVSVMDPGSQVMQYLPPEPAGALQSPAEHESHEVEPAPGVVPNPEAVHTWQATVESVVYVPVAHMSHVVAPCDASVSVIEPAGQASQLQAEKGDTWYSPGGQLQTWQASVDAFE
jgi:hypothetical protein